MPPLDHAVAPMPVATWGITAVGGAGRAARRPGAGPRVPDRVAHLRVAVCAAGRLRHGGDRPCGPPCAHGAGGSPSGSRWRDGVAARAAWRAGLGGIGWPVWSRPWPRGGSCRRHAGFNAAAMASTGTWPEGPARPGPTRSGSTGNASRWSAAPRPASRLRRRVQPPSRKPRRCEVPRQRVQLLRPQQPAPEHPALARRRIDKVLVGYKQVVTTRQWSATPAQAHGHRSPSPEPCRRG